MEAVFLELLNASVSASWLILVVIVLRLLLKNAPKWVICLMWAVVAIRLVFPFSLHSPIGIIPESPVVSANEVYNALPTFELTTTISNNSAEPVNIIRVISAVSIISRIWVIGMTSMIAYLLISYLKLKRKVDEAALLCSNIWLCDAVDSPFILGILKPKIYLPSDISPNDMLHAVAHERAHLQRKDHWWKPLGFLLLSVFWFNPIIWIAYVLMCKDIELACDQKVIERLDLADKKNYSLALLECSSHRKMVFACPLAFGEVAVGERVKGILNYKKPKFWIIVISILVIMVVSISFLTSPTQITEISVSNGVSWPAIGGIPPEEWGIEMIGTDITPNGMTVTFKRADNSFSDKLVIGEEFWLEQLYANRWYHYPLYINPEFDKNGTEIKPGKMVSKFIDWTEQHHELEGPAHYRLGMNISHQNENGETNLGVYYVTFDLGELPTYIDTLTYWNLNESLLDISSTGVTMVIDRIMDEDTYSGELYLDTVYYIDQWKDDTWEQVNWINLSQKQSERILFPANGQYVLNANWENTQRELSSGRYRIKQGVMGMDAAGDETQMNICCIFEIP